MLAAALLLVLTTLARADDVREYKDALARGAERFEERDYAGAREAFEAAFQIHADPVLVFNIASTYRREGDLEQAVREYHRYLSLADANDRGRRTLAEETIESLEDSLTRRAERAEAEREAARERAARRPVPPPAPTPRVRTVEMATEPTPPPRRSGLRLGGLALGAAGTASLALAIYDFARARDAQEQLDGATEWNDREADLYEVGQAASRRAVIAGAVGAGLVGIGVTMYLVGNRASSERPVTVTPMLDDRGAGAVLRTRF